MARTAVVTGLEVAIPGGGGGDGGRVYAVRADRRAAETRNGSATRKADGGKGKDRRVGNRERRTRTDDPEI